MRIRSMGTRITSQRLRASKRKAGMPARSSSLLSRLGKAGGTSRLSALNASSGRSALLQKSGYAKLEKAADSLTDAVAKVMDRAERGAALGAETQNLVNGFNDTLKLLKQSDGVLNNYYRQSLKELSTGNKNALEKIGITVAADGTLSLNAKKLERADGEEVKKLLGADGAFVKRAEFVASRVSDNAAASEQSISGRYNASGNYVDSGNYVNSGNYINSLWSRYNMRG